MAHPRDVALKRTFATLVFVLVALSSASAADEPVAETPAVEEPAPSGQSADPKAKLAERSDDVASILVLLLGGIVMLALVAFATILIWGRRVRQSLREAPTKSKARDELWYLKPKAGLPPENTPPPGNG